MLYVLAAIFSVLAHSAEITRFKTIHGPVAQNEDTQGRSSLTFLEKGNQVALPAGWSNVNVDQVLDLNGQTAILMSHGDEKCGSRMALLVVAPKVFWGPYDLGDCEDVIAYQRSEDGKSLIAIRAENASGKAWVYSSDDQSFRGPVTIRLPESMAFLVPKSDANKPSAPSPSAPAPSAQASAPAPAAGPAASKVASALKPAVTRTSSPAPAPSRAPATASSLVSSAAEPGALSRSDASKVVADAKSSTPPQRPKIMIAL